jgi:hypothetical protein
MPDFHLDDARMGAVEADDHAGTALFGPQGDRCSNNIAVVPIEHPELTTTEHTGMISWQRVPVAP